MYKIMSQFTVQYVREDIQYGYTFLPFFVIALATLHILLATFPHTMQLSWPHIWRKGCMGTSTVYDGAGREGLNTCGAVTRGEKGLKNVAH